MQFKKLVKQFIAVGLLLSIPTISFADDMDMHAHHHHHEMKAAATKSQVNISIPDVEIVRQDKKSVKLLNEINDGRVTVISFVYTTCTAVCPMTSQILYNLQEKLGAQLSKVHIMSISIDPENDTPEKLAEYAKKYHAKNAWQHYTSSEEVSIKIQKAFGAYKGDKMNHSPVTLIKAPNNSNWVKIDGFSTPDELNKEIQDLIAQ